MNSTFNQCSLYLHPSEHDFTLEKSSAFINSLQTFGFLSQKTHTKNNSFLTGDKFLEYIAYMGCSPNIEFEPTEDNKNYCHIILHQYKTSLLQVSTIQTRAPHCPSCHKPVKDWRENITNESIRCTQCQTTLAIEYFDWRKMAGYSRLFLEITDIFPKEAIPQQVLLDKLASITNIEWQYFYSCKNTNNQV